jgi:uncharacterized caspase-like protein
MNALALVIGNAKYTADEHKLVNAVNDANDFGNKLLNLGFVVHTITDCNNETFDRKVKEFGEDLKKFDVGLFYFSGHGLQIKGENYLTAIDTSFVDEISAKHTSYQLNEIISYMQEANPLIKILILDACRDNPLPKQFRGVDNKGLAPINAPKGTLIAFSTSPGEKAMDYGAGRNSIYTGALLNHIDDPNIPIEDFFKRVRTSVHTLSNGKQTSWEHTSLIGDFYFNSDQLIHSIELPYKEEYIADEKFRSIGSEIDEIIESLRSYNFYTQQSAFKRLESISVKTIDESSLFLLGRNILQTATGGEFTAIEIIKNLDTWLVKYFKGEQNHILNGILFEIYFNSKGQFRYKDFKNELIDEVFKLQSNLKFKSSFDFIVEQLLPFKDFIFYLPSFPAKALPIEVQFEPYEQDFFGTKHIAHRLISVKYEEIELLNSNENNPDYLVSSNYDKFIGILQKELCVPKYMLRLSMNANKDDIRTIHLPWELKLSRLR